MAMHVLDGVKPITHLPNKRVRLIVCFEREKKAYIAGLGGDQLTLEHLGSPMTNLVRQE